jgi:hypothetical protein
MQNVKLKKLNPTVLNGVYMRDLLSERDRTNCYRKRNLAWAKTKLENPLVAVAALREDVRNANLDILQAYQPWLIAEFLYRSALKCPIHRGISRKKEKPMEPSGFIIDGSIGLSTILGRDLRLLTLLIDEGSRDH